MAKKVKEERKNAREEGYEKGFAEGKSRAEQECLKQMAHFEEIVEQIDNECNQMMEELKPQVTELVFDITEKVLDIPFKHQELQKRAREEVSEIIEQLDDELQIKVTLSKADFEKIQPAFENNEEKDHISLQADEEFNQGEYKVETKKEYINKRFKEIIADFRESVSFNDVESLQLES